MQIRDPKLQRYFVYKLLQGTSRRFRYSQISMLGYKHTLCMRYRVNVEFDWVHVAFAMPLSMSRNLPNSDILDEGGSIIVDIRYPAPE